MINYAIYEAKEGIKLETHSFNEEKGRLKNR